MKETHLAALRARVNAEKKARKKEEEKLVRERREEKWRREHAYEELMGGGVLPGPEEGGKMSNELGWDEDDFM